jgi:hydroxyacylglutathione hydrolase
MEIAARTLFNSLQWFKTLPAWLQVWPGHGAGSACGKGLSSIPHSTVGYETRFNWAFDIQDEAAFVEAVLAGQPEPPRYFAAMKRINKEGPRLLHGFHRPEQLPASRIDGVLASGATVVDMRHAADFAGAHVPGTVNIELNKSFTMWAGWLLPYDREFYLIADERSEHAVDEAIRDLAMIGLDRVAGYFGSDTAGQWAANGRELASIPQMTPRELAVRLKSGDVTVIDVRGRAEWEGGHLPGVANVPLGYIRDHLDDMARDKPLVLQCQGGARSAIAASVLRADGFDNVVNLTGGFIGWQHAGLPVEREESAGELMAAR